MTKTERRLLFHAAVSPSGFVTVMTWYSTSANGGICGTRKLEALNSLEAKGLVSVLRVESNQRPNIDQFGTTHATEYVAKITDSGRDALRETK